MRPVLPASEIQAHGVIVERVTAQWGKSRGPIMEFVDSAGGLDATNRRILRDNGFVYRPEGLAGDGRRGWVRSNGGGE